MSKESHSIFPGSAQAVAALHLWRPAIEAEDHDQLAKLTASYSTALGRLHDAP